jgi:GTPase SAR1 family protein
LGQLLGKHQSPRYLYLVGPGGIGKTYFARQLVQWFEEICPDALHLQELAITAPEELEGTGVKRDVPLMLVIVASNNEIKEPALKSRFDCIDFPMPTEAALQNYAGQLAFAHELADEIENFKNGNQIAENYRGKLLEAIKEATNFREIESIVPAKMVEWEEELWNGI